MDTKDSAIRVIFLLQNTTGILGNFYLAYHFLFLYFTGRRSRPTDLILKHMILVNLSVILSKAIPETLTDFGWKRFINNLGCKFVPYLHRVSRNVSIGTTCSLSVFQVIMISPSDSRWAELKGKAPRYIGTFNMLCWTLNMILNILVPLYTTEKINKTINIRYVDHFYCYSVIYSDITENIYMPLVLFYDVFFLVLMVWSSGSMVLILHRHKQRVQYLHRKDQSARPSPETTATKSILIVVCFFVSSWTVASVLHCCMTVFHHPSFWLRSTYRLIEGCFPTLSPYILMSHDTRRARFCSA
uniref:Vomeronasal type-1 receptor n=1 Tax=Catagonus wagneri TaxID=51154 RepID=A0A8C3VX78_9CETA